MGKRKRFDQEQKYLEKRIKRYETILAEIRKKEETAARRWYAAPQGGLFVGWALALFHHHDLVDRGVLLAHELLHHVGDGAASVSVEVLTHPGAEIGRLTDVDGIAVAVLEDIDTGLSGKCLGEPDLRVVGAPFRRR